MNWQKIVATCFGFGRLLIAPGTWGSLFGLLIWIFIPLDYATQFLFILITFILGLYVSKIVAKQLNDHDPSEIVIDEVVGMMISLYMLPKTFGLYFTSFCLFRILDIFKPSLIYHSQKLSNGWGIMMDDILAGIITLLIMQGLQTIL